MIWWWWIIRRNPWFDGNQSDTCRDKNSFDFLVEESETNEKTWIGHFIGLLAFIIRRPSAKKALHRVNWKRVTKKWAQFHLIGNKHEPQKCSSPYFPLTGFSRRSRLKQIDPGRFSPSGRNSSFGKKKFFYGNENFGIRISGFFKVFCFRDGFGITFRESKTYQHC